MLRLLVDRVLTVVPVSLEYVARVSRRRWEGSESYGSYRLVVTVGVRSLVLALVRRLVVPLTSLVEARLVPLRAPLPEAVPLEREEVLMDVLRVELRLVMEVVD